MALLMISLDGEEAGVPPRQLTDRVTGAARTSSWKWSGDSF